MLSSTRSQSAHLRDDLWRAFQIWPRPHESKREAGKTNGKQSAAAG